VAITITDVAEEARVSIKTVSRVLNGEPNVREETRERVLAAARALDYRPNLSARSLAGTRSFLIGHFFDNPSSAYVADIQEGALSACRAHGYHLVVESLSSPLAEVEQRLNHIVSTLRLDGAILTPPVCDNAVVLKTLEAGGTPYVRVAPAHDLDRAPWVGMDDELAAFQMTEHLLDLGHRDIAFIKGPPAHAASRLRYRGFERALKQRRLNLRAARVGRGDFSFGSGFACAAQILTGEDRPSAIFASNDEMALGAIAAAHSRGLAVPDALSVAGFDDTPAAERTWPQLTTIHQPILEMAAAAAEMLIAGAREPATGRASRVLDFRLVGRASTGPAPASH
jgi:LacI family transcriptional regulator